HSSPTRRSSDLLDDSLRQDPAWWRTGHAEKGRDGCRVPLPWRSDAPGLGFSPTGRTWLPQPESWAALAPDVQEQQEDSTLSLYRRALALRAEHRLGAGAMDLVTAGEDVVAVRNTGEERPAVVVMANLGTEPVALPEGHEVLVASGPLAGGALPTDTTVWLRAQA